MWANLNVYVYEFAIILITYYIDKFSSTNNNRHVLMYYFLMVTIYPRKANA